MVFFDSLKSLLGVGVQVKALINYQKLESEEKFLKNKSIKKVIFYINISKKRKTVKKII